MFLKQEEYPKPIKQINAKIPNEIVHMINSMLEKTKAGAFRDYQTLAEISERMIRMKKTLKYYSNTIT